MLDRAGEMRRRDAQQASTRMCVKHRATIMNLAASKAVLKASVLRP